MKNSCLNIMNHTLFSYQNISEIIPTTFQIAGLTGIVKSMEIIFNETRF